MWSPVKGPTTLCNFTLGDRLNVIIYKDKTIEYYMCIYGSVVTCLYVLTEAQGDSGFHM